MCDFCGCPNCDCYTTLFNKDFEPITSSTTAVMDALGDHEQAVTAMACNLGMDTIDPQTSPGQWFVAFACWQQACQFVDNYTNNDFADIASQGIFAVAIPAMVQAGIVQYACSLYVKRLMGLRRDKVGDVEQTWDAEEMKKDAIASFGRYRKQPGF